MALSNLVLGSKYCHPGAVVLRKLVYATFFRSQALRSFATKTGKLVLLRCSIGQGQTYTCDTGDNNSTVYKPDQRIFQLYGQVIAQMENDGDGISTGYCVNSKTNIDNYNSSPSLVISNRLLSLQAMQETGANDF